MPSVPTRVQLLLIRFQQGLASKEEVTELFDMISTGDADADLLDQLQQEMEFSGLSESVNAERKDKVFNKIKSTIAVLDQEPATQRKKYSWIAVAASIIFALGIGSYFYLQNNPQQVAIIRPVKNDIAPGQHTATLTLANGQKIVLSNAATGQIAKQAGVSIAKTTNGRVVYTVAGNGDAETGQLNTLSTAKGETYQVNLPDGTQVWLNAASSLTYPARFFGADRKVKLIGEAYFEVAKDKSHPFKVTTNTQEVTVLGTHFNINAYSDETAVATTLLEGSVKVASNTNTEIIKPGQQTLTTARGITINNNPNIEGITDWKDGDFALNNQNFKTAMRKIARWYDVEIIYDASIPDTMQAGGWISRNNNISAILKLIESSGQVHFKVEGRRILVRK